jgi:IS605 OrfB family transposase
MREFGLTARQYNAVVRTLDGMWASYRERLDGLIAEDRARLSALTARNAKDESLSRRHHRARRIAHITHRIAQREQDRASGRVRICFGSRRLFNAQHALVENTYADHAAWQADWRAQRSSQFFVLGSKDETAGCQGCVLTHLGDDRFSFRLRLPNGSGLRSVELQVRIRYGWQTLLHALAVGQAISYRFLRDDKGWRVFISTQEPSISTISDIRCGAIGVDLNADHLALSRTDRFGNLVAFMRIPLVTYGLTEDQAKARLGNAVRQVISQAVRCGLPIVIERLDFAKKRATLSRFSRRYARMLSSFAYTRFAEILKARAHDAGIELRFVNPAYSSIIGKQKFSRRYGISGHTAAALVLARRASRFSERVSRHGQVAFVVPVRTRQKHVWSSWALIARRETAAHAAHVSSPSSDPPAAFTRRSRDHTRRIGATPIGESVLSTVRKTSRSTRYGC